MIYVKIKFMRLYNLIIVYNMAAPATSQQATDLLEDESLAEEVKIYFDIC